ncbi:STAS domain-containing protein [Streptacidiphilus jiangxiensis]|uniref:Anti-sigma factor antagonist n=1 Tax=Streptacidiphilus jiangxiensis TaxID=235985 RepID=A0A1H7W8P4_STRJI|nr:STAS domain-containing protein [Streptacidiphilus jiangxiensis]SEM17962.1 anti-anti-sigma factor [Streptacidiphilus jiangxiensis]
MRDIEFPGSLVGLHAGPRLKADVHESAGTVLCVLNGDLDLHTRSIVQTVVNDALTRPPPVLCIDMGGVHFCDSAGLALLLSLRAECKRHGGTLALVAPSARVSRLLELTDAAALFPTYADWRAATAGPPSLELKPRGLEHAQHRRVGRAP